VKRKAKKIEITHEAELAIQRGNKSEAARLIRIKNGLSLLDAQRAVESFASKHKHEDQLEQATLDSSSISQVQVVFPLMIALVAVYPFLYQTLSVLIAGDMGGRCVNSPLAICRLWPIVGNALFGASNAYLGYVLLMGLIASTLIGLAYWLYKR
jgi:hypothetical protein